MGLSPKKENLRYSRVLLKLSGEALAGEKKRDIDPEIIHAIAHEVKEIIDVGVQVGIVIGAGNIFRGAAAEKIGIDRITGDHMGMLATVMNSLALKCVLESMSVQAHVLSAIEMPGIVEHYSIEQANNHLSCGRVVIAAGGTGHPFFTTDTAASLRAIELGTHVLLKATRVDGVYTSDPEKDASAKKFDTISYIDVISKNLKVMDITAVSLCRENAMPLVVFNLFHRGALKRIVTGEKVGTRIS